MHLSTISIGDVAKSRTVHYDEDPNRFLVAGGRIFHPALFNL